MLPISSELHLHAIKVEVISLNRLELDQIRDVNVMLFQEERLISKIDHPDLIALMLRIDGVRAGFKIGYGRENGVFYSAKGGILPIFRRKGYAKKLMFAMMQKAQELGYHTFRYDTFPKHYREMLLLGLKEGFEITQTDWNDQKEDFRIELSASISEYLNRDSAALFAETAESGQSDAGL